MTQELKEEKEWKRFMAGDQWTPEERKILEDRKVPPFVINRIKPIRKETGNEKEMSGEQDKV